MRIRGRVWAGLLFVLPLAVTGNIFGYSAAGQHVQYDASQFSPYTGQLAFQPNQQFSQQSAPQQQTQQPLAAPQQNTQSPQTSPALNFRSYIAQATNDLMAAQSQMQAGASQQPTAEYPYGQYGAYQSQPQQRVQQVAQQQQAPQQQMSSYPTPEQYQQLAQQLTAQQLLPHQQQRTAAPQQQTQQFNSYGQPSFSSQASYSYGQQQQQQQQQPQVAAASAAASAYASSANQYANQYASQYASTQPPAQMDTANLQKYSQYLEILQKHYGIQLPGQTYPTPSPVPQQPTYSSYQQQHQQQQQQLAQQQQQAAAQAEAQRQVAAQAEAQRQAAAQAEAQRQAAAQAEAQRQAAAQAEAQRQAAAQAEVQRQAAAQEAHRQAEAQRQAENQRQAAAQAETLRQQQLLQQQQLAAHIAQQTTPPSYQPHPSGFATAEQQSAAAAYAQQQAAANYAMIHGQGNQQQTYSQPAPASAYSRPAPQPAPSTYSQQQISQPNAPAPGPSYPSSQYGIQSGYPQQTQYPGPVPPRTVYPQVQQNGYSSQVPPYRPAVQAPSPYGIQGGQPAYPEQASSYSSLPQPEHPNSVVEEDGYDTEHGSIVGGGYETATHLPPVVIPHQPTQRPQTPPPATRPTRPLTRPTMRPPVRTTMRPPPPRTTPAMARPAPRPAPQPQQPAVRKPDDVNPSETQIGITSQALTQQIRRLPAVLYVDSRKESSAKIEELLRETYGLPLVSFYVDKIDRPATVQRHLQQLTAHKGLPYLFICGTFIGSDQHIDNYHKNGQIPQLIEYVCGDEKKKKNSKGKTSA